MSGFLSSPQPVVASRPARRFTVAQANRALPLVSRIVADVVKTHDRAMALQARAEPPAGKRPKDRADNRADDRVDHRAKAAAPSCHAELDAAMDRLQDYVAELAEVGCELKDYRTGLVDFVGRHQGRDVLLCWRLGEDRVGYWHELNAGVAGRKPVSVLDERG